MRVRIGRIVVAAVAAETAPILVLILITALFGPHDQLAAEAYAKRAGQWVGPVGGGLACILAAYWALRSITAGHLIHGVLVGLMAALIDVALLVASGAAFEWLFMISNAGRVLAGAIGGLAGRRKSLAERVTLYS